MLLCAASGVHGTVKTSVSLAPARANTTGRLVDRTLLVADRAAQHLAGPGSLPREVVDRRTARRDARRVRRVLLLIAGGCSYAPSPAEPTVDPGDGPPPDSFSGFVRRINVAGAEHVGVEFPGVWEADPGTGGVCVGSGVGLDPALPIAGTVDDPLFSRQVFGLPTVTCQIPSMPAGTYEVSLLFGPIYYGAGASPACMFPTRQQIFDIRLEGGPVLTAYNLTAESNGCVGNGASGSHPVVKVFTVEVTDGALDIQLTAPASEASMISAIQVIQTE